MIKTLYIVGIILITLLIFRILAECKFLVNLQQTPLLEQNTNTALYHATNQLLLSSPKDSDFFVPLSEPLTALISRIELVNAAESSIDIQYYLFHADNVGDALLAAIINAAERGVSIRLLIDGMDISGKENNFIHLDDQYENLSIRIFNPLYSQKLKLIDFLSRFPRSSRRMHNKSLTADRIVSIVGGRNIGNEYFHVNSEVGFIDFDAMVAGKVAKRISNEFDEYWYSGIAFDIEILGSKSTDSEFDKWKNSLFDTYNTYSEILKKEKTAVKKLIQGRENGYFGKTELIFDPANKVISGIFYNDKWMSSDIIHLMQTSEKSLHIISPYFIPTNKGIEIFSDLRKKGVSINIITNSFAANDVIAVHAGYSNYRKRLLKLGVNLYELKAKNKDSHKLSFFGSKRASLHAKTFIVDNKTSFIGSFNLDPRSALHNTEMGIVFTNKVYAGQTIKQVTSYLNKKTYGVTLNCNENLQWLDKAKAETIVYLTEPDTTFLGRLFVTILSWLPIEWLL